MLEVSIGAMVSALTQVSTTQRAPKAGAILTSIPLRTATIPLLRLLRQFEIHLADRTMFVAFAYRSMSQGGSERGLIYLSESR